MRIGLALVTLSVPLLLATAAHAERHYDCTKPGNANKAACKAVPALPTAAQPTAPAAKPAAAAATPAKAERHYDCTKPANRKKAACKNVAAAPPAQTTLKPLPATAKPSTTAAATAKPAPAPQPSPASPPPTAAAHSTASVTTSAAGATGQCKDGTFTHSKGHSGACSHHGGVAKWL